MSGRTVHRSVTLILSMAMIVIGVAAIARTAAAGGSGPAVGYLLGVGLVVAGALRLWVVARTG